MTERLHRQIRLRRQKVGMTLRELAPRVGMPISHLSLIERGQVDPRESSLEALAHSLDAEIMLVPRTHVSEMEKLIELVPQAATPSAGSTFSDVFIPDPPEGEDS